MLRNKLNLILAALVILAACEQMPTNNPSAETEVSEDVPSTAFGLVPSLLQPDIPPIVPMGGVERWKAMRRQGLEPRTY